MTNLCCFKPKEVLDSRGINFFNNGGEEFVWKSVHFSDFISLFCRRKKSESFVKWKTEMEDWFTKGIEKWVFINDEGD